MRLRTVVVGLLGLALLIALGVPAYFSLTKQTPPWASNCTATVGGGSVRLDLDQARNAAVIAGVAARRGLPTKAVTIGIATALQESGLRNLDHGDRDSLGLFQQRPSQGWGTAAQVQEPFYAATAFFVALEKVKGWQAMDPGDVAQAVQRSGFPDAYDKHISNAGVLAAALAGDAPAAFSCTAHRLPPADPAGLTAYLGKTLPKTATVEASGSTVTVSAADARSAWSAAHLAIADAETDGVRSVTLGERTWRYTWPLGASWGGGDAAATRVVIELG